MYKKGNSQTNAGWQPIYLLISGSNIMDGIEADFQINTCNGEDIVYVKFINHSAYPVKLEWFDAVFSQELKWINKDKAEDKKSLILPASSEAKGDCLNNKFPELIVKIKDFVADKKDFKRYSSLHLSVTAVK